MKTKEFNETLKAVKEGKTLKAIELQGMTKKQLQTLEDNILEIPNLTKAQNKMLDFITLGIESLSKEGEKNKQEATQEEIQQILAVVAEPKEVNKEATKTENKPPVRGNKDSEKSKTTKIAQSNIEAPKDKVDFKSIKVGDIIEVTPEGETMPTCYKISAVDEEAVIGMADQTDKKNKALIAQMAKEMKSNGEEPITIKALAGLAIRITPKHCKVGYYRVKNNDVLENNYFIIRK